MNIFDYKNNLDDEVYSQYEVSKMILRDHLAADRTILSNQNTFLAYVRTALTLFVAGVTFVRFFDTTITEIIGWIFIPIGILTFLVGLVRYNIHRKTLCRLQRCTKARS
jgi:putative membrane protein